MSELNKLVNEYVVIQGLKNNEDKGYSQTKLRKLRRILLRTTYINFMEKNPQKNASSKALK
jgi:hypothetical protein